MLTLNYHTFEIFKNDARSVYDAIQCQPGHKGYLNVAGNQFEVTTDPGGNREARVRCPANSLLPSGSVRDNTNDRECLSVRNQLVDFKDRIFTVVQASSVPYIAVQSVMEDQGFLQDVEVALGMIQSTSAGRTLLAGFAAPARKGHSVTICRESTRGSSAIPLLSEKRKKDSKVADIEENNRQATIDANKRLLGILKGRGADAQVRWNPDFSVAIDAQGYPSLVEDRHESFVVLAHELVHARRIVKGTFTAKTGEDPHSAKSGAGKEELRTVGLGRYSNAPPSENAIRREHHLPERRFYSKRP